MIASPLSPGAYSSSQRILREAFCRDVEDLRDRWQDEAAAAALAKDPTRALHIESWIARI